MFRVVLLMALLGVLLTQITATPLGLALVAVLGVGVAVTATATVAAIAASSVRYHRSLT